MLSTFAPLRISRPNFCDSRFSALRLDLRLVLHASLIITLCNITDMSKRKLDQPGEPSSTEPTEPKERVVLDQCRSFHMCFQLRVRGRFVKQKTSEKSAAGVELSSAAPGAGTAGEGSDSAKPRVGNREIRVQCAVVGSCRWPVRNNSHRYTEQTRQSSYGVYRSRGRCSSQAILLLRPYGAFL